VREPRRSAYAFIQWVVVGFLFLLVACRPQKASTSAPAPLVLPTPSVHVGATATAVAGRTASAVVRVPSESPYPFAPILTRRAGPTVPPPTPEPTPTPKPTIAMPTAPPDDPYGLTDYVILFDVVMGWEIPSVYYLSPAGNLMPVPLPDESSWVWEASPLHGRWMLFGRTAPEKQGYVYVGGVLLDLEDGSRRSFEAAPGCAMSWPTLSSDGRYLAFRQHNYGVDGAGPCNHIRLHDLETGHVQTVLEGEELYSPVFWSSATGRFYFQLVSWGSDRPRAGIWSLTPQGTGWEELPDIGDLWWLSPDGAVIAYLAFDPTVADYRSYYGNEMRGPQNELHLLDLRTGETRLLLKEQDGAEYLTAGLDWLSEDVLVVERVQLSADGEKFMRREVLFFDVDEGIARPLFQEQDVPTDALAISPSPKGRWLMVTSYCLEGLKGWLLDAETGERRNLLIPDWMLYPPVWCDRGERLAYSLEDNIVRVDAETLTMTVLWQGEAVRRGVVSACR
jgi:hypothetical protein